MTDVNEIKLPGVGLRHDFLSRSGRGIGVVSHTTGRRDLVIYDADDLDAALATAELTEEEGRTLGELLGGSRIVERLEELPHEISGLVIDWLHVDARSRLAEKTIGECRVREETGAGIVAIVRGDDAVPAPGPEDRIAAGDTVVVVGTHDSVAALTAMLEGDASEAS